MHNNEFFGAGSANTALNGASTLLSYSRALSALLVHIELLISLLREHGQHGITRRHRLLVSDPEGFIPGLFHHIHQRWLRQIPVRFFSSANVSACCRISMVYGREVTTLLNTVSPGRFYAARPVPAWFRADNRTDSYGHAGSIRQSPVPVCAAHRRSGLKLASGGRASFSFSSLFSEASCKRY